MMPFSNRREAGRALARKLSAYAKREDVLVLALPRGGVPVAYEIAEALDVPLDVFVARKLGVPGQEELAMGAIASGGLPIFDAGMIVRFGLSEAEIQAVVRKERRELARRERAYRGDRPPLEIRGRTVLLVDDGLATGFSMRAAVEALRPLSPARIVIAVPVAPRPTARAFRELADEFVCLATPEPFHAVGEFYRDFDPTEDREVLELLAGRSLEVTPR
jgi:putative phosphoribosyl transferase